MKANQTSKENGKRRVANPGIGAHYEGVNVDALSTINRGRKLSRSGRNTVGAPRLHSFAA